MSVYHGVILVFFATLIANSSSALSVKKDHKNVLSTRENLQNIDEHENL